jgi:hypothetical protein
MSMMMTIGAFHIFLVALIKFPYMANADSIFIYVRHLSA